MAQRTFALVTSAAIWNLYKPEFLKITHQLLES
jgi:hypothetical protein